jgi:hypothetical protein
MMSRAGLEQATGVLGICFFVNNGIVVDMFIVWFDKWDCRICWVGTLVGLELDL